MALSTKASGVSNFYVTPANSIIYPIWDKVPVRAQNLEERERGEWGEGEQ